MPKVDDLIIIRREDLLGDVLVFAQANYYQVAAVRQVQSMTLPQLRLFDSA
jgi:hypothetical protein